MLETIDMFDVNWLAGMSVGLFTLQTADVKTVVAELDKAMGPADKSPLAGILRIIPIERMNALLVVTPQPAYLEEAKKWIDRLDKGDAGGGVRFYVYQVQNSRAERIGPLLQQAFTGRTTQQTTAGPPTWHRARRPGLSSPRRAIRPSLRQRPVPRSRRRRSSSSRARSRRAGRSRKRSPGPGQYPVGPDGSVGVVRNVQVVADKDNNTVLIVATPAEYAVIEAALKKLDVPQRQVLIQLTIAEVTLTDDLTFGIDWLFRGGAPSGRGSGGNFNSTKTPFNPQPTPTATGTTTAASAASLVLQSGFNYMINNAMFPGGVQAAAPARQLRQHARHLQSAPGFARQPESDDQGRRPDPDQPADLRRRHDRRGQQRRDDDLAVHRYRRAGPGDAAYQRRRAGHAGGQCRGQQSGQSCEPRGRAADQHAVGPDAAGGSLRADDGHGRPDP
jgi:type II secretory pathway component GspD/PulD (secretin)